jgi:hypothetical protein
MCALDSVPGTRIETYPLIRTKFERPRLRHNFAPPTAFVEPAGLRPGPQTCNLCFGRHRQVCSEERSELALSLAKGRIPPVHSQSSGITEILRSLTVAQNDRSAQVRL